MRKQANKKRYKPLYVLVSGSDTDQGTFMYCDGAYWSRQHAQNEMHLQYENKLQEIIADFGEEFLLDGDAEINQHRASISVDICPPDSYVWEIYERVVEVNWPMAVLLGIAQLFWEKRGKEAA